MNYKFKKVITNWRIIILVTFLLLAIIAINPSIGVSGVAIRAVAPNSSASAAGISIGDSALPKNKERIIEIDTKPVKDLEDYFNIINSLPSNSSIVVKTNQRERGYTLRIDESEIVDLGLTVSDAASTNIRKGLDLQGGTRVLLKPEEVLNEYDTSVLIENMKERLNVYGLSDIVIREAGDLSGNKFIIVEIAGATEDEIKDLIAKQGKFEAKIANKTIFSGGEDIPFVCRSADCSGLDYQRPCSGSGTQWGCNFRFEIALSQEAAERQAEATRDLEVFDGYLSEPLEFYLDGILVDSLQIVEDLKGQASARVSITGGESGTTQQAAALNAIQDMRRMQTILITGSLPTKLEIIKSDSVSPILGVGFVKNSILMALLAIAAVATVLVFRYKKLIIAIPIIVTMLSEVLILLGVASFIGWNIDLAAIAGILAAIGTGVDDQIVITDETLSGEGSGSYNWKQKIKRAFLIVMLAYLTVVVAMIPLVFAGAGLLKGFAITTIIGVTVGVFVTRPAYAAFIELFLKN